MARRKLRVRDAMSTGVATLGRNDTLAKADELMRRRHIRHVPVLDEDGALCGVVTHRDLFRGALLRALGYGSRAEQHLLDSMVVKEAMSENPATTGPDATLGEAARLMQTRKVGCLPVVEGDKLVGILTEGDFLRLVAQGDG